MRRLPRALLTLLAVLTLCACGDKAQDGSNGEDAAVAWDALSFDKSMPLDYAAQFSVSYAGALPSGRIRNSCSWRRARPCPAACRRA